MKNLITEKLKSTLTLVSDDKLVAFTLIGVFESLTKYAKKRWVELLASYESNLQMAISEVE